MKKSMRHITLLAFVIILTSTQCLFAQTDTASRSQQISGIDTQLLNSRSKPKMFYGVDYRYGQNKPHRESIKNLTYHYQGVDARIGWQTFGNKAWQHAYRMPSFGVGLSWNTFTNDDGLHTNSEGVTTQYNDILGNPFAAYFFTNFPQFRYKKFRFDLELNLGVAVGLKPHDEISNPLNNAISSTLNANFGLFLEQSYSVAPNFDIFIAEGLNHYSNAAIKYPNMGLNIMMAKVGVRYHPDIFEIEKRVKPKIDPFWYAGIGVTTGMKRLENPKPVYHEVALSASINRRLTYKNSVGIGYEVSYNTARQAMFSEELTTTERMSHAIFGMHEFVIDRFSIGIVVGFYVKNPPTGVCYTINDSELFIIERLNLGYDILPQTRVLLSLKAHRVKAEYIELGISQRINFVKKNR